MLLRLDDVAFRCADGIAIGSAFPDAPLVSMLAPKSTVTDTGEQKWRMAMTRSATR
ncbi:hypothetical protein ACWED2_12590 [Amycolatopsis sp. NPDC005003]